ncbi:unnamed protein product [Candidula unifasciata]|uniref:Hexosyltransferase n=1 Tax=Candidula unifasciata TaxID=100452 RepID=A0A8S3ZK18_9EUPU|nr:unnamed protein product [Candidula unifasciata]
MKLPMLRYNSAWRFLSLVAIVATITSLGLLNLQTSQCAGAISANNFLLAMTVDNATAKLDINNEQQWLKNYEYLSRAGIHNNSKYVFFSSEILIQNISKYGEEWFKNVPDDDYLAANLSVFTRTKTVKNMLKENYLIKAENVCKGRHPFVLFIIPSVADDIEERDAIRWTWLRAAETNSWPRAFIRDHIKHIFLFGRQASRREEDYEQLLHESNIVGDIVMADFDDTYRNLSRKVLSGLNWARKYCPGAQFVLKTDQDTFINAPLMMEVLHKAQTQIHNDSFVMGLEHTFQKPFVVRGGKWAVSPEEYPLDFYPHYLYGHTYVLSQKAVVDITDTAPYVPLISPEDAFITGILPKVAGVSRITARSFTVCCRDIFDCEVVWNQNVALPEVKSPSLIAQLWANIITHSCNDTGKFIR